MTDKTSSSNFELLGEITWLMSRSSLHSTWAVGAIRQWVTPTLLTKQFRLFRANGRPVAYLSWAYLSKEVEEQYLKNTGNLRPNQWQSGDRLWLTDMIAEDGFGRKILT